MAHTQTVHDTDVDQTPFEGGIHETLLDSDNQASNEGHRGVKRKFSEVGEYGLVDLVDGGERENAWQLPPSLAAYFNKQAQNYIEPKLISEYITDVHPVPSNVIKRPRMDDFLKKSIPTNTIHGEGQRALKRDKGLEDVWDSIIKVTGPLGRLWGEVEEKKKTLRESVPSTPESPPLESDEALSEEQREIADLRREVEQLKVANIESDLESLTVIASLIQQSLTLVGQSANKVTFLRRLWGYASMPTVTLEMAMDKIKDKADILKTEETFLFGEGFADSLKIQTAQLKEVAKNARVESDLKGMAKGKAPSSETAKELMMPKPFRESPLRGGRGSRGKGNGRGRGSWGPSYQHQSDKRPAFSGRLQAARRKLSRER